MNGCPNTGQPQYIGQTDLGITRRGLIYSGVAIGGGLVVYSASRMLDTGGDGDARTKFAATTPDQFGLNAWIKIAQDGQITFAVHRAEMGQGITTSLPMILAEELDADWDRISYEFPPGDKDYYNFGVMGRGRPFGDAEGLFPELGTKLLRRVFHARGDSLTLSSTSIIDAYDTLRPAGAAARAMLISAAAEKWGVPAERLKTERHRVIDPQTGESADFGELAETAATAELRIEAVPKARTDYTLIGRNVQRLDIPAKVDGSATFGADINLPDMLYGAVAYPAVVGSQVQDFDASAALAMPGVEAVVPLGEKAVGVLASNTWVAMQAAKAVRIESVPLAGPVDSAGLHARYEASLDDPEATIFRDDDEVELRLADGPVSSATYQWPFLAHVCMEPMNCTAWFDPEQQKLNVWVGTQAQTLAQQMAATSAGLEPSQVTVHRTFLGGGFGRRAEMDFVERAAEAAMQAPGRPVKLSYSREQDVQHDMYRPAGVMRLSARVGDAGVISAIDIRLATQSVVASFGGRTPSPRPSDARRDKTVSTGAYNLIYDAPAVRLAFVPQDLHVPVGYWRSTSTSYTAFCIESFMDELAAEQGMDPVAFRLANLAPDSPRRAVLEMAAEKAGWGESLPAGRARGVALFEKAETCIAQIVEISADDAGELSIYRVVCVVDPGQVVHPDTIVAMMEGGINFGIDAAINGEITLSQGQVQQDNFVSYPALRLRELPDIEVHILPQGGRPEGVGETAVPGLAPAIANAIYALTGNRVRRLPLGRKLS
jgi:isoquinoline 1-oxidoreductase beta subunit